MDSCLIVYLHGGRWRLESPTLPTCRHTPKVIIFTTSAKIVTKSLIIVILYPAWLQKKNWRNAFSHFRATDRDPENQYFAIFLWLAPQQNTDLQQRWKDTTPSNKILIKIYRSTQKDSILDYITLQTLLATKKVKINSLLKNIKFRLLNFFKLTKWYRCYWFKGYFENKEHRHILLTMINITYPMLKN